jgi:hypothetical protein
MIAHAGWIRPSIIRVNTPIAPHRFQWQSRFSVSVLPAPGRNRAWAAPGEGQQKEEGLFCALVQRRFDLRHGLEQVTTNQPFGEWNRVFSDSACLSPPSTGSCNTLPSSE